MNTFEQPTDQDALTLTHAIALQESGKGGKPDYNAVGDAGTSHGAYQWQPGNFESAAKQYGLDPSDRSPSNQDKVAYAQVKAMKDKGLDPGQIASSWNSGNKNNWKDHSGDIVINGQTIHYDTPAYVKGVQSYYQKLKGGSQPQQSDPQGNPFAPGATPQDTSTNSQNPFSQAPQEQGPKPGFFQDLASSAIQPFQELGLTGVNAVKSLLGGTPVTSQQNIFDENKTVEPINMRDGQQLGLGGSLGKGVGDLAQTVATVGLPGEGGALLKAGGSLGTKVLKGSALFGGYGALQGGGQSLAQGDDAGTVVKNTAIGGGIGLASGAGLGLGSALLGKGISTGLQKLAPQAEQDATNLAQGKEALKKDIMSIFGETKSGYNALQNPSVQKSVTSMIDEGIIPGVSADGKRFDTTNAAKYVNQSLDTLDKAKQSFLSRDTTPIPVDDLRQLAIDRAEKLYADEPGHKVDVIQQINDTFDKFKNPKTYGDTTDLSGVYKMQNENNVSNKAKFNSLTTPTEKMNAARTIYGALKDFSEGKDPTNTLKDINAKMTQYQNIRTILKGSGQTGRGGLNGTIIKTPQTSSFLGRIAKGMTGRAIGTAAGGMIGGVPGAVVGGELEQLVARALSPKTKFGTKAYEGIANKLQEKGTGKVGEMAEKIDRLQLPPASFIPMKGETQRDSSQALARSNSTQTTTIPQSKVVIPNTLPSKKNVSSEQPNNIINPPIKKTGTKKILGGLGAAGAVGGVSADSKDFVQNKNNDELSKIDQAVTNVYKSAETIAPMVDKRYIKALVDQESTNGNNELNRKNDQGKYGWTVGFTKPLYDDLILKSKTDARYKNLLQTLPGFDTPENAIKSALLVSQFKMRDFTKEQKQSGNDKAYKKITAQDLYKIYNGNASPEGVAAFADKFNSIS